MIIRPEPINLRIKRGTKYADIPSNAAPPLNELDSPFQYAEYLSLKVRHDPHDVEDLVQLPTTDRDSPGASGSNGPRKGNERDLWVYEHLRRLPIDITPLVTSLLGTCTPATCPKMKADEWQYLCVAHGSEGAEECSAIDYILHTLDSTTTLLNSSEIFPSRIQIPHSSLAHFPSLFRRLSRIFSHAYFHHRELFQLAEAETSLYARFVALCEKYDLVGTNLLVIPRSVVADVIDGKQAVDDDDDEDEDEDDEDEEEEEEEEEDVADQRDSRRREKGEGGRRPHSLDRHPRPHKLDDLRQKGDGTVKGWTQATGGAQSQSDTPTPIPEVNETAAPAAPASTETFALQPRLPKDISAPNSNASTARTLGRSTLGRKGRGTMLWTSDTPESVPAVPEEQQTQPLAPTPVTIPGEGAPLQRTESVETAIMIDPEHDVDIESQILPTASDSHDTISTSSEAPDVQGEPDVPEPAVPKDEIELLEEEGKIPSAESSVSPLPPPESGEVGKPDSVDSTPEVDGQEEMQEIKLDEPTTDVTSEVAPVESGPETKVETKAETASGSEASSIDNKVPTAVSSDDKVLDETEAGSGVDSAVVEDTDKVVEHVEAGGVADEDPITSIASEERGADPKPEAAEGQKSEKKEKKGKSKQKA